MLEACVSKINGDIIVTKPEGSVWSDAERDGDVLKVILLDDDTLPQNKVVTYPYKAGEPENGNFVLSQYKVDVSNGMPELVRVEDLLIG